MNFIERCGKIQNLFTALQLVDSRNSKEFLVGNFKNAIAELIDDLNYCFEVLAGKHKLGYTYQVGLESNKNLDAYKDKIVNMTIKDFVELLQGLPGTDDGIMLACSITPSECREFIRMLVNREYKLGYSNLEQMRTNLSPMLAKRYPDTFHSQYYYIQEKLDGNRCIAYYDNNEECWKFQSRSGKPLKVDFDMSWADTKDIFDGEVMTLGHAGSRDFNRTSGIINSKYLDKSSLHYYIYDIVDETRKYKDRKTILEAYAEKGVSDSCTILPVLDYIWVWPNISYNYKLDEWLDKITAKGGEGIMLRDPEATYKHTRTDALIKYKKLQTMDLRIVGWNEGSGKYEGAIGSFVCTNDEHTIEVNVAGMTDAVRFSNPDDWMNKIIEVAYFDSSKSKTKDKISLRFPRMKKVRDDKDTTSIY